MAPDNPTDAEIDAALARMAWLLGPEFVAECEKGFIDTLTGNSTRSRDGNGRACKALQGQVQVHSVEGSSPLPVKPAKPSTERD